MSNAAAANGSVTNETKKNEITAHFAVKQNKNGRFIVTNEGNGSKTTTTNSTNATKTNTTKTNATTTAPAVAPDAPPVKLTADQKIKAIITIPALDYAQLERPKYIGIGKPERDNKVRSSFADMIHVPVDALKDKPIRTAGEKHGGELPSLALEAYTEPEKKIILSSSFDTPEKQQLLKNKYIEMDMEPERPSKQGCAN
jgi:hypothetical protein